MTEPQVAPTPQKPRPNAVLAGTTLIAPIRTERLYSIWKGMRGGIPSAVYVLAETASEPERERFADSAKEMQQLGPKVPGVLVVHEVAQDGRAFAADLHDTGTADHIPQLGWPVARRAETIKALCDVLGELHSRGVIHGCLRPTGLVLDREMKLIVTDVGLCDVTTELVTDESDGMSFGVYAPPEAATGGLLDARSDVYSVGRILQHLLLGFVPDPVIEPVSRLDAMAVLPVGLTRIVRKAITQDPGERYATMAEMAADIERHRETTVVGTAHPDEHKGPKGNLRGSPVASAPTAMARAPIPKAAPSTRTEIPKTAKTGPAAEDLPKRLRLGIAIGGGLILLAVLSITANGVFLGPLKYVGLVLAALALSATTMAIPIDGKSPLLRRVAYALVVGLLAAVVDPAAGIGEAFASWRIRKGGGASNAAAFKSAVALGRKDFPGIDLHGADLSRAQLVNLKLDGADLTEANLTSANLNWSSIEGADISSADLTGVDPTAVFGLGTTKCSMQTKLPVQWKCEDGRAMWAGR